MIHFFNSVVLIMSGRTYCQDQGEPGGEGEDEGAEAEHDEMLFECAGQVLTNLGKATPDDYASLLRSVFPILIKLLVIYLIKLYTHHFYKFRLLIYIFY